VSFRRKYMCQPPNRVFREQRPPSRCMTSIAATPQKLATKVNIYTAGGSSTWDHHLSSGCNAPLIARYVILSRIVYLNGSRMTFVQYIFARKIDSFSKKWREKLQIIWFRRSLVQIIFLSVRQTACRTW